MAEQETYRTANTDLHGEYRKYFWWFTAVALAIHVLLIFFFVTPRGEGFEARAEEMEVIEIPPEIKIPPPPEEIARPATPVIAEEPVEEDITIAETEITEEQEVTEAPPPPPAEPEVGNQFTFTPYTVKPKCKSGCSPEAILRHVPPLLRKSGVSCKLTVGIRIDTNGQVTATDLLQSSGNSSCDQAARKWAQTTTWTTAYNRDQPVVVWIAQPVRISTR
ncbi:MAG: TonB family protein [Gemmatimonadota bacterium]|nr:TonB family protein [Gemmatimonadota bacterium]